MYEKKIYIYIYLEGGSVHLCMMYSAFSKGFLCVLDEKFWEGIVYLFI